MPDETRDPRGKPATSRLSYTAYRFARALNRAAENTALARGLTLPQLFILQVLGEGVPMSNADVARRTFVSAQAAHLVVAELLRSELIERVEDATNRRVRLLRLSDEGWRMLADCEIEINDRDQRLEALVGPATGLSLTELLDRAATHLAGGYFGDTEAEAVAVAARRRRPKGGIAPS